MLEPCDPDDPCATPCVPPIENDCCSFLPTSALGPDIVLKNDHEATEIAPAAELRDCMRIRVHNCHGITRVPDAIERFGWLEVLHLTHCSIPVCDGGFPASLRTLTISYCQLSVFEPRCLNVARMASIDLSHNRLTSVPKILGEFEGRLSIDHNELWFTQYSWLPYHRVVEAHELMVAYRLNLLSTERVNAAVEMLSRKRLPAESAALAAFVNLEFDERTRYLKNTHANTQNVHLVSVQTSTQRSIELVMALPLPLPLSPPHETETKAYEAAVEALSLSPGAAGKVRQLCAAGVKHPQHGVAFSDLLVRVHAIASRHEHSATVLQILRDEVEAGLETCLTGLMSRMVGALSGFVDGVKVTISSREELSNAVLVVRRSGAARYGNSDAYLTEVTPVVLQLLEDFCVPEPEHESWLQYL
jgi:hypothetical protein